ncbi:MAG: hypothetical protein IT204_04330 [Fimbriimonadaceae bacterium]|nr:hypothetical protein [Fimbriimonadaceae bacterium]
MSPAAAAARLWEQAQPALAAGDPLALRGAVAAGLGLLGLLLAPDEPALGLLQRLLSDLAAREESPERAAAVTTLVVVRQALPDEETQQVAAGIFREGEEDGALPRPVARLVAAARLLLLLAGWCDEPRQCAAAIGRAEAAARGCRDEQTADAALSRALDLLAAVLGAGPAVGAVDLGRGLRRLTDLVATLAATPPTP